jgi:hypothetical protein
LQGDADLRDELGRRGRQRVLAHYTQAAVAEATAGAYLMVLGAGSASRSASKAR